MPATLYYSIPLNSMKNDMGLWIRNIFLALENNSSKRSKHERRSFTKRSVKRVRCHHNVITHLITWLDLWSLGAITRLLQMNLVIV